MTHGAAIVEVRDESEAHDLGTNDPAIKAGLTHMISIQCQVQAVGNTIYNALVVQGATTLSDQG